MNLYVTICDCGKCVYLLVCVYVDRCCVARLVFVCLCCDMLVSFLFVVDAVSHLCFVVVCVLLSCVCVCVFIEAYVACCFIVCCMLV